MCPSGEHILLLKYDILPLLLGDIFCLFHLIIFVNSSTMFVAVMMDQS